MRIGVLTGGGDCPGLNQAIRAITTYAIDFGDEVIGIIAGWRGLIKEEYEPLTLDKIQELISLGGTIISTSRTNPYKSEEDKNRLFKNFENMKFDALIAIGGEDTLSVATKVYKEGIPVVGVPKTMDNDLSQTDYTIGFDTAVTVAVEALERLRDTARSHRRIMFFEVMGRHAGWVALFTGLAGGADWILIPEAEVNLDEMCEHLKNVRHRGKIYSLVVVSEGIELPELKNIKQEVDEFGHVTLRERGVGELIAKRVEDKTGLETRTAVVGHIQRGGPPTVFDRVLATRLGVKAMELIKEKKFGKMVALKGNQIKSVDLELATSQLKLVSREWYELAKIFFK